MIRLLRSVAFGVAAAALLLTALSLGDLPVWVLPVASTAAIGLSVLSSILKGVGGLNSTPTFRGTASMSVPDLDAAEREGRFALAKVLETRGAGATTNHDPVVVCNMRVIVAPRDRPAYETPLSAAVPLVSLFSVQRGAVVVVVRTAADRPEVAWVEAPPEHWRQLAEQDTQVRAMEHAPAWEMPPLPPRATAETPALPGVDRFGRRKISAVVLILAAAAGFVATLWPTREPLLDLMSGSSLEDVRTRMEQEHDTAAGIFPADSTEPADLTGQVVTVR
jgi:hypothetical protein